MKNKKTLRLVILFLVLCLTLGTLIVYDNFKLDITEYSVKNTALPKSFNNFKIVHLSDLHNTEFGKDNEKLLKIIKEQKERWLFAGVVVIAANSGGAWSPIGDVTTIMLWMNENVTSSSLMSSLLLPNSR